MNGDNSQSTTRLMLNPLEIEVLEICAEWASLEQIHEYLFERFPIERVRSTVSFLRRRYLLAAIAPEGSLSSGHASYKRTDLGLRTLLRQRGAGRLRVA